MTDCNPNPHFSFGKRNGGSARRPNECFVLENSEMIVIQYPEEVAKKKVSTFPAYFDNDDCPARPSQIVAHLGWHCRQKNIAVGSCT